ncbi:MAG: hypothetical protein NTY47_00755, partial [Candidatus Omnitrophica bacterium]|nr:hypothetical protein [Candidatus Omnitrophota bacterium]
LSIIGFDIILNGSVKVTQNVNIFANDHSFIVSNAINSNGGAGTQVTINASGDESDVTLNADVTGHTVNITAGRNIIDDRDQTTKITGYDINLTAGNNIGDFDLTLDNPLLTIDRLID